MADFYTDVRGSSTQGYWATCNCGWRSETHGSRYAAEFDGDEHVELAHETKEDDDA